MFLRRKSCRFETPCGRIHKDRICSHLTAWLPSVKNIIWSIFAKSSTNASDAALEPIWHIAVWRAYLLLTLKHSACVTFAFPTALKGLFLAQTMSIKSFFLSAVYPAAYSFTRVFIQRSPQGSSSLYNALRKEGIIMNRRNSDVRREKVLCELFRIIEMSEHEFSWFTETIPCKSSNNIHL